MGVFVKREFIKELLDFEKIDRREGKKRSLKLIKMNSGLNGNDFLDCGGMFLSVCLLVPRWEKKWWRDGISVKRWWVMNVMYLIYYFQLLFFTAEYEKVIEHVCVCRVWNAIYLNCVKNTIDSKAFQKWCLIGSTSCDVYRGHGCTETQLELLKFGEHSLVPRISAETFQQEQPKCHLVRVISAVHCNRQSHQ